MARPPGEAVAGADGRPLTAPIGGRTGAVWASEAAVVPDRPGKRRVDVAGWEQHTGAAVAKRVVIASTAGLTVWCLHREAGAEAAEVRRVLVRLSGRPMGHRVESTGAALLAGLGKLLAVLDLLAEYDLGDLRRLTARVLPDLFDSG